MNKILTISILSLIISLQVAQASDFMAEHAKQNGHNSCLSLIKNVEQFLTKPANGNVGTRTSWSSDNANTQLVSSSIELTFSDGSILVDVMVAPTVDGQCSFSYTKTMYHPESCLSCSVTTPEKLTTLNNSKRTKLRMIIL